MPPCAIGTFLKVFHVTENCTLLSVWDLYIPSLPLQHVCLPGS